MKSQLTLNRVGSWMFVIAVVIALSFSGCTTVSRSIPVTDEIINTILLIGMPDAQDVYYYASKTITVRFTTKTLTSSIINHEIHWDYSDINYTVRITPQTPGVINGNLSTSTPLHIVFTTDQGATEVIFRRTGTGSFEYDNVIDWKPPTPSGNIINRSPFEVSYRNPNELPSLLVVSQENVINR